jgi:hypothetical protein|tara:strand:- start:405 stop:1097 length:693 start_codon:yes stop_codon:yes gene_type:complete
MSKTLIIMGNGPSLADVNFDDLEGYDTFGLNSAYRAYYRMNWWPTYHGCFDYRVTANHREKFVELIDSGKIKKYFYIRDISNKPNFQHINLLEYGSTNKMNNSVSDFSNFHDNGNSGANACSVAVCLGYKKIILLGVDCNYVEFVDGSKRDGPGGLVMEKTPDKNPNYWFDDYQQKGDEYNVPAGLSFHMPTWNKFAYRAAHNNIEVINCSPITTLKCFKKMTLKEALRK